MPASNWDSGDSFFLNIASSHLYFLLHAPIDGAVVVVNFVTLRERMDPPCIIYPKEHDFLTAKSTIDLSRAKIWTVEQLMTAEQSNMLRRHSPVSESILNKVLKAIGQSDTIETRIYDFLSNNGVV